MTRPEGPMAITGSGGFLGFHTRAALQSRGVQSTAVALGRHFDEVIATASIAGTERLIHLAGVNRGTDAEIADGNVGFAHQLARAIVQCPVPPALIVNGNSTQSGNGTVYGQSKEAAAKVLQAAAVKVGAEFIDVQLPNLFGEHGRPFYNSVTATFAHLLAIGEAPEVQGDRELALLHAQDAADILTGAKAVERLNEWVSHCLVSELLQDLGRISGCYRDGIFPPLASKFQRDLFNTYRSFLPPSDRVIGLTRHADARGSFFELTRSADSSSQSSFSTTVPGVIRGDHFHRRKIERFTVLAGSGRISMRKLFSDEVLSFDVEGNTPVAIDMPTLWTHNIENVGDELLYTSFWANEFFDPDSPDTFQEKV